ncbi:unnamed protein product [Cylicocyclus nassatus]|uniref:G-protein coupled receptors family 1 profile domain-containing protein n=1 Tax=Cylicocyclus nassatus TaxID=53992 RepID=A0AA36DM29_CYLNA|nr:unnamed protein product [Cylicocyclus nassatus]
MNTTGSIASVVIAIHDFQLAAIIIFLVSSIGTICNLLVAFFTSRLPSLSNPFGRLSASQSTGEMILCITFALYYSPMVYFDISSMKRNAHHVGLLLLISYNICIISHLVIALNRMCAICFPLSYEKAFSHRNTSIMIAVIWIVSFVLPICLHGMGEIFQHRYRDKKDYEYSTE